VFSWDPRKAITNFQKHDISFEEAATVFGDLDALDWADEKHSRDEPRFKRLGRSALARVVMVAYTLRKADDGKETIRIISARQASRNERQVYFRS